MCVNSSPPSAAYMLRWTGSALVQVMVACCCLAPSHYLNQCWLIVNCTLLEQTSVKFEWKYKTFIQDNAFGKVCKMVAILSRGDELWDLDYKLINHLWSGSQFYISLAFRDVWRLEMTNCVREYSKSLCKEFQKWGPGTGAFGEWVILKIGFWNDVEQVPELNNAAMGPNIFWIMQSCLENWCKKHRFLHWY